METTETYTTTLDKAPDVALALGTLSAEWANLEHHLADAFICLLGDRHDRHLQNVGRTIFYSHTNLRPRLELIKNLSRLGFGPEFATKIDGLTNRINKAAKNRNKFVHDIWMLDPLGNPNQWRIRSNESRLEPVTAKDIQQCAANLRVLSENVHKTALDIEARRRAFLEKQSPQPA